MKCEKCGEREAGFFTTPYCNGETGKVWFVTCTNCDADHYWIDIDDYFNPDCMWDDHLESKRWFDPSVFNSMLGRYARQKDQDHEYQDGTDYV